VAEVGCQGPIVDALIDQLKARSVPQQMRVHVGHADARCGPAERFEKAIGRKRCPPLAHEYMTHPSRLIPTQFAQRPNFDTAQRLHTVITALAADYLQSAGFEYLIPAQSH